MRNVHSLTLNDHQPTSVQSGTVHQLCTHDVVTIIITIAIVIKRGHRTIQQFVVMTMFVGVLFKVELNFDQRRFQPVFFFSSSAHFDQKVKMKTKEKRKRKRNDQGGTVNVVRVCVNAAGDAFMQTRLMPAFRI